MLPSFTDCAFSNIILSGGNTMFKGLSERLTKEIKILSPESIKDKVKVLALNERKFGAFIGGAFLPLSSQFESMRITKTEYEEFGATIVHRKCFWICHNYFNNLKVEIIY